MQVKMYSKFKKRNLPLASPGCIRAAKRSCSLNPSAWSV